MTKDEILKKAQMKKPNQLDEMERGILLKGHQIGLLVGLIACFIIVGIKIYLKQPYQDILSVFCAMLCGQYLYKGTYMKNILQMALGVIWGMMSVSWAIQYFM